MRRDLLKGLALAVLLAASTGNEIFSDSCCNTSCCETSCETSCCVSSCNTCCDTYGVVDCQVPCCGKSRTFFMPRSISNDLTYEDALHYYYLRYDSKNPNAPYAKPSNVAALSLLDVYFYQQSTGSERLASYFLKCNKNCLEVRENGTGDLGSGWFGVFSDPDTDGFSSNLTICPTRKVWGATIKWQHDLSEIYRGLYYNLFMPIVQVDHELNLCESNVTNQGVQPDFDINDTPVGTVITNMTQALNQRTWGFGRWSCKKLSKVGIDDMVFDIGWNAFQREHWNAGIRLDMLIPMGSRTTGLYLFEPTLGQGRHFGLGFGLNFDWNFWNGDCGGLTFLTDFRYRYYFSGTERRAFDLLCNGDYSRYLLTSDQGIPCIACPGINSFTRDVKVTPRSTVELLAALHYQYNSFGLELGYNLWWRQSEQLCLDDCWCDGTAITGAFNTPECTSSSKAQICNSATPRFASTLPMADAVFTQVNCNQFDICSATTPSVLTHKLYAGGCFDWKPLGYKSNIGFGGAYEFRGSCNAMAQWSVWGRTAFSF